jgi:hypothetical protein
MNKIIAKIEDKLSDSDNVLSGLEKLSNSELNTFLLELFRIKSQKVKPTELVKQFNENRFVVPADTDIIQLKEIEIQWLKYIKERKYKPVNLSPVAPFATCSSVGLVNQNNVISALRGTEVVSDASNILALKIANEFRDIKDKDLILRYSASHRHIRGQYFENPNFSTHFTVLCLASGGFDTGNYNFEITQLEEHVEILYTLIKRKFTEDLLFIRFLIKEGSEKIQTLLKQSKKMFWTDKEVVNVQDFDNKYYKTIQFKIGIRINNQAIEVADGGDVDWTQKLLGNKKHRLFISGIGIDLMEKLYITAANTRS